MSSWPVRHPRRVSASVLRACFVLVVTALCAGGCESFSARAGDRVPPAALVLEHLWANELTGTAVYWDFGGRQRGGLTELPSGMVVLGLDDGRVVATDRASGELLWTFRPASVPAAVASAAGDEVVGTEGEPAEGGERFGESEAVNAAPVLGEGTIFVGGSDGRLYAIDPRDGSLVWQFDTGGAIEASAAVADGKVVVANSLNRVFALDARTGTFLWRQERPKPIDYTMLGHTAPVVRDGMVYAGFSDGQLMAYTLSDGQLAWGRDLSAAAVRFPDVDATPLLSADGALYTASFAGGLYRLDAASNEVVWRRDDVEGASEVTLVDDVLYLTSRYGLQAIDAASGEDLWLYPLADELVTSPPVVGRRYIYVAMQRRGLLVVERNSGRLVTLVDPGSGMSSRPVLSSGRLFGLSNGGVLYGWRVDDAPLGETPRTPAVQR